MTLTQPEILFAFFILNSLLIIGDASLGYFVLPMIFPPKHDEQIEAGTSGDAAAIAGLRRMLTVLVLLYMLVNCYAYFREYTILLYIVTALVVLDIIIQLVLRQRRARKS